MPPTLLITGFDAFLDVRDNPSGVLARRVNGRRVQHHTVIGQVLPVSYIEGLSMLGELVDRVRPALAIGVGVHRGDGVQVETCGRNRCSTTPDVHGVSPADLGEGPPSMDVALPVDAFVKALRATVSRDAGSYLCNAWLYTMLRDAPCPSLFVHIPARGVDPERFLTAVDALVRSRPARLALA